ncbi:MAG: hypothetical protein ACOC9V_05255 [Chloroflexota bacterium]
MLFRSFLFSIVIVVLLGGCVRGAEPPTAALSLAPADGCAAPCWRGIRPGETTGAEAEMILQAAFGQEAVAREGDFLTWTAAEGVTGRAALTDGRVGALTFELAEGALTVDELLAQIGSPDEVQVSLPHVPRNADQSATCELLRLRYPRRQLEVTLYGSESGEVLPEQSVSRLYLAPARPELSMMTPFYGREWAGYGAYCVTVDEFLQE